MFSRHGSSDVGDGLNLGWERFDASRGQKESQVLSGLDCPVTLQWIDGKTISLQPEENLVNVGKMF